MKFLIIDDEPYAALKIAEAIADLGEVMICTLAGSLEGIQKSNSIQLIDDGTESFRMPPKIVVVAAIEKADFILLDGKMPAEYDGKILLQYCMGKKVLGVSSQFELGQYNWYGKIRLQDRDKIVCQPAAAELRKTVEYVLAQ